MQQVSEKDGGNAKLVPLNALANAKGLNQRGHHPSMDSFVDEELRQLDPLLRGTL